MASREIKDLDKRIQDRVRSLLDNVIDGYEPFITDGFRSFDEQTKLYNQGRSTPGNIVTYAKAGQSAHNYGLAVDLAWRRPGTKEAKWLITKYRKLAPIAKELGFEWGGDWTNFKDNPHYELKNWRDYIDNSKPVGGSMSDPSDTISIPTKTFEELVTKSSRYDEFASEGWTNPQEIKNIIKLLKEDLEKEKATNGQTADEFKQSYKSLVKRLAEDLNTVQQEPEIFAEIRKALEAEESYRKAAPQYDKDRKGWLESEMKLKDEIARLKALRDQESVLSNSTNVELLSELLRRLQNIVRSK